MQRKIHRLPFGVPNGIEAHPIASSGKIVADFYNKVKKSSDSMIAYKGGHYERDLLNLLKIPSVNLESFNCPQAEALLSALVWMDKCSNHTVSNAYHHCGKFEVEAFGCWLVSQKVQRRQTKTVLLRTSKYLKRKQRNVLNLIGFTKIISHSKLVNQYSNQVIATFENG